MCSPAPGAHLALPGSLVKGLSVPRRTRPRWSGVRLSGAVHIPAQPLTSSPLLPISFDICEMGILPSSATGQVRGDDGHEALGPVPGTQWTHLAASDSPSLLLSAQALE